MKAQSFFLVLLLLGSLNFASWCYQEFANVSTPCGGLATGGYNGIRDGVDYWRQDIGGWRSVVDGNWNTYGQHRGGDFQSAPVWINYSKPGNALNTSQWRVRDSNGIANLTLPGTCWNIEPLKFLVESYRDGWGAWYCWTGGSWNILRSGSGTLYEEAMLWNLNASLNTELPDYYTTISPTSRSYDNVTFEIATINVGLSASTNFSFTYDNYDNSNHSVPPLGINESFLYYHEIPCIDGPIVTLSANADILNVIEEFNEYNNEGFGSGTCLRPDLVISLNRTATFTNSSGNYHIIEFSVKNLGDYAASPSYINYSGPVINISGNISIPISGNISIPQLNPLEENLTYLEVPCSESQFTLRARVDPNNSVPELYETNNDANILVPACLPNLKVVLGVIESITNSSGTYRIIEINVTNDGIVPSPGSYVNYSIFDNDGNRTVSTSYIPPLELQETNKTYITMHCTPFNRQFRTHIDYNNSIIESNEYDNVRSINLIACPDLLPVVRLEANNTNETGTFYQVKIITKNNASIQTSSEIFTYIEFSENTELLLIPILNPFQNYTVNRSFQCLSENSLLSVDVDFYNVIEEAYEDNNQKTILIPSCFPDFTVSFANIGNFSNLSGTYHMFEVMINNTGFVPAGTSLLSINNANVSFENIQIPELAPRTSTIVPITLECLPTYHTITVYADSNDSVQEMNENNNIASVYLPPCSSDINISLKNTANFTNASGKYNIIEIQIMNRGTVLAQESLANYTLFNESHGIRIAGNLTIPALFPGEINRTYLEARCLPFAQKITADADITNTSHESNEFNNQANLSLEPCVDLFVTTNITVDSFTNISGTYYNFRNFTNISGTYYNVEINITNNVSHIYYSAIPSQTRITYWDNTQNIPIPTLAGQQSHAFNFSARCSANQNTLTAQADYNNQVDEAFEDNNLASLLIPACPPDYQVRVSAVENGTNYARFEVRTINTGLSDASEGSYTNDFFYSLDLHYVAPLAWNQSDVYYIDIPCEIGQSVSFWAYADSTNTVPESDEANNFDDATGMCQNLPNLVSMVSIASNFTNDTGTYYQLEVTVTNTGTVVADPTQTRFTQGGTEIGTAIVHALFPLQSNSTSVTVACMPSESQFVAEADWLDSVDEADETDNTAQVAIPACVPTADLIVSSIQLPQIMLTGRNYEVPVSTRNNGTGLTLPSITRVSIAGIEMAELSIPSLGTGETYSGIALLYCPSAGKKTVLAAADANGEVMEANEQNNEMQASVTCMNLSIGPRPQPNFTIDSIGGSPIKEEEGAKGAEGGP